MDLSSFGWNTLYKGPQPYCKYLQNKQMKHHCFGDILWTLMLSVLHYTLYWAVKSIWDSRLLSSVLNFSGSLLFNHTYFYAFINMKGNDTCLCLRTLSPAYLLMFEKFFRAPSQKKAIKNWALLLLLTLKYCLQNLFLNKWLICLEYVFAVTFKCWQLFTMGSL